MRRISDSANDKIFVLGLITMIVVLIIVKVRTFSFLLLSPRCGRQAVVWMGRNRVHRRDVIVVLVVQLVLFISFRLFLVPELNLYSRVFSDDRFI